MPTLHLICGLPCAGKTTLARQLETRRSALRLTPDEWIVRLYAKDISGPELDAVRDPVESVLWDLASRVLALGVDVILDFGFWSRNEREEFRSRAFRLGARSELHFLNVPEDLLLARLAVRNENRPPGTLWIDSDRVKEWIRLFEPPDAAELNPRQATGSSA
jgi:predicted kinase